RSRAPAEPALRRLLRPDRLRVPCSPEPWRRGGRVSEEERPPPRPGVQAGGESRDRAPERRRGPGGRLVPARVARQSGRRRLRRHRTRRPGDRARLPGRVRGVEARAENLRRVTGGGRMDYLTTALRQHQELAIFLTLAIGFLIGKVKFGSFA